MLISEQAGTMRLVAAITFRYPTTDLLSWGPDDRECSSSSRSSSLPTSGRPTSLLCAGRGCTCSARSCRNGQGNQSSFLWELQRDLSEYNSSAKRNRTSGPKELSWKIHRDTLP